LCLLSPRLICPFPSEIFLAAIDFHPLRRSLCFCSTQSTTYFFLCQVPCRLLFLFLSSISFTLASAPLFPSARLLSSRPPLLYLPRRFSLSPTFHSHTSVSLHFVFLLILFLLPSPLFSPLADTETPPYCFFPPFFETSFSPSS